MEIFYILGGLVLLKFIVTYIESNIIYKKRRKQHYYYENTKTESTFDKYDVKEFNKLKYKRKYLLSKFELCFYKDLKVIADKYNLHVLSKVRMADIVEPQYTSDKSVWYSAFGKIKSKHVDFALANPDNLYISLLIELDDNSHKNGHAQLRDEFVDMAYESANIPILHVSNSYGLEEKIISYIELQNIKSAETSNN